MRTLLPTAGPAETRAVLRLLLRGRRGLLAGALLLMLIGSTLALLTPALLGRMVDAATAARMDEILWLSGGLLVSALLGAAVTAWGSVQLARLVQGALAQLREDVLEAALHLPAGDVERAGSGDLVSRVTGDVEAVGEAASSILPAVTGSSFAIGITVVGLGLLDPRLALAAMLAAPLQIYVTARFVRRSRPVYRELRVAEAERGQHVIESVNGADTLRALRAGEAFASRAERSGVRAVELQRRAVFLRTRFYGGLNLGELIGLSAVLTVGFILVGTGEITVGAATAAALYFHRLFAPVGALLSSIDDLQRAGVGLARLVGVLGGPRRAAAAAGSAAARGAAGLSLSGVTYIYPAEGPASPAGTTAPPALSGVDLEIRAGERIALVGASGGGKSTLARLIAGQLPPSAGRVRRSEGGRPSPSEGAYLLSQEVHAFDGTLAEDLRLVSPNASDAELLEALARVGADGWLNALPAGLDTPVGVSGATLGHAQLQRIALARVILADPPLAVLDEATAAESGLVEEGVDAPMSLERAAEAATAGRTAVIVAHRLSQARRADRVAVFEGGRVTEVGTHEELLGAGGGYAALWRAWSRGREEPGAAKPRPTRG